MTNRKREPKGTSTGGQFAPSANPESSALILESADGTSVTVAVSRHIDLTEPVKTNAEAVDWCDAELARVEGEYNAMVEGGRALDPDAEELRDYVDELRDQLVDHQRDLITELRAGQEDSFDLNGSIADTICYRVSKHTPETIAKVKALLSDWEPDYEAFDDAISSEADAVMEQMRDELVAIVGEFEE